MSLQQTLAQMRKRERRVLRWTVVFFLSSGWLVYSVEWPWWVEGIILTYFTLNLIVGLFRFARIMRILDSPVIQLLALTELSGQSEWSEPEPQTLGERLAMLRRKEVAAPRAEKRPFDPRVN